MLKHFIDWLVLHPISKDLLFGLLFLILGRISIKWATIKSFLTVPPQKLSSWISAARLLAAEQRLKELHRLNADMRYVIWKCTFALLLMAFSAVDLAATVALIVLPQSDPELNRWFSFPFDYHPYVMRILICFNFLSAYVLVLLSYSGISRLRSAIVFPKTTTEELERKITELREKMNIAQPEVDKLLPG